MNLYPFRETVASGRGARRGRRADRHRRPGDGARRGEELRVGRRGGRPGRYDDVARRDRTAGGRRAGDAARAWRREAFDARGGVRRGDRGLVRGCESSRTRPATAARARDPRRSSVVRRSATARTRTSAAALYAPDGRRPVRSAAPRCCRARRCRSTTGWTRRRRGAGRRSPSGARPAAVIVKHNNPCGVARGRDAGGGVRARLRVRHGLGVRRDRGVQRRGGRGRGARDGGRVHRGGGGAGLHGRGAWRVLGERENLRVVRAPLPAAGGLEVRPIDGGALVQDADTVVETRDDMKVVDHARADRGPMARPAVRVDGRGQGEVERDRAGEGRGDRRGRRRPDEPGVLGGHRARAGRGAGAGVVHGVRRVLPVPRRHRPRGRGRRRRHHPAGRFDARRGGPGRGRGARHRHGLHRPPALPPLADRPSGVPTIRHRVTEGGGRVTARIIDGKAIAAEVRGRGRRRVAALVDVRRHARAGLRPGRRRRPRRSTSAASSATAPRSASHSERIDLPADISQEQLLAEVVDRLNADPACHGIIVQLPLPAHIDELAVHETIAPRRTSTASRRSNVGRMVRGDGDRSCRARRSGSSRCWCVRASPSTSARS